MSLLLILAVVSTLVANVSQWKIEKRKDPMTDEVSCVASVRGRSDVLLTDHILWISTKLAPEGKTIRFDDQPAQQSLVLPDERTARAIMLGKFELDKILEQKIKRVRYRVITVLDRLIEGEVDVSDIDKVLGIIRSDKCRA